MELSCVRKMARRDGDGLPRRHHRQPREKLIAVDKNQAEIPLSDPPISRNAVRDIAASSRKVESHA